jgi:hypothetical protein
MMDHASLFTEIVHSYLPKQYILIYHKNYIAIYRLHRISIILKGQLEERTADDYINVSAGSLVIKPQHTGARECFWQIGTTLLSISFLKRFFV